MFFATPMSNFMQPGFCPQRDTYAPRDVSKDWVIDHVDRNKLNNTGEPSLGES
jgi:hypothetical protein